MDWGFGLKHVRNVLSFSAINATSKNNIWRHIQNLSHSKCFFMLLRRINNWPCFHDKLDPLVVPYGHISFVFNAYIAGQKALDGQFSAQRAKFRPKIYLTEHILFIKSTKGRHLTTILISFSNRSLFIDPKVIYDVA